MKISSFQEIDAWKVCRDLVQQTYAMTTPWPYQRRSLADQMQRAAVSSMANIAEGFDGSSDADFVRFLGYARQSVTELQSHFFVALDQLYITNEQFKQAFEQANRSKSIISGLIRYLRKSKTQ